MSTPPETRMTAYHWKLFFFLGVATFFEGYDAIALSQILPNFRRDMGVTEGEGGVVVAVINVGTILAYVLVRKADKWGRRRVLTVTIAGYTVFSFLTGLAPNLWVFAFAQLVARIFLIAEWATSMVYAAEEFPAEKRGLMIGLMQGFSSLGSVACAGLVPMLLETPWGWRTVYFVGTAPLVLLAFARQSLKESHRFEALTEAERHEHKPILRIFKTPYRKRVLQLAAIWALTYVCTQTAVTFWKEYANRIGLTDGDVGLVITVAAVGSMPLVFGAGKLLDWIGRRAGAVLIFSLTVVSCVGAYTVRPEIPFAISSTSGMVTVLAVCGAIFGASAVLPVLNAYTTELFPTHLRGDAFAWSNNLLGRIGYVLAPAGVGVAAGLWGWGPAVAVTAIGPMLALVLILWLLPETSGKSLEETSAMAPQTDSAGTPTSF